MKFRSVFQIKLFMNRQYNVGDLQMLQDDIGAWYYKLNGKPYTGYAFAVSTQTNMLTYEGYFVEGYLDGTQRYFHDNGQLKSEENFLNNIQHGSCKEWDENGVLRYECACNKGNIIWSRSYNERGEVVKEYGTNSDE
jgi:antitoxin component YwqK of YwqJK toxin-antitoxin module